MTNCHIFNVLYFKAGYLSETFERHTIKYPKEKRTKGRTMIYKTLHRNLKITQQEPHKITGRLGVVKAGAPEV